jgi:hypothetical protein
MKKLFLLLVMLVSLVSCEYGHYNTNKKSDADITEIKSTSNEFISIVEVDGHEYLVFFKKRGYAGGGGICHSESCKNEKCK